MHGLVKKQPINTIIHDIEESTCTAYDIVGYNAWGCVVGQGKKKRKKKKRKTQLQAHNQTDTATTSGEEVRQKKKKALQQGLSRVLPNSMSLMTPSGEPRNALSQTQGHYYHSSIGKKRPDSTRNFPHLPFPHRKISGNFHAVIMKHLRLPMFRKNKKDNR